MPEKTNGAGAGRTDRRDENGVNPLRILIIQPWIKQGGAELISVYLASELRKLGHRSSIVCTYADLHGMPPQSRQVEYQLPAAWLAQMCQRSRLFFLVFGPWILLALTFKQADGYDVLNPHNFPAAWVAAIVGAVRGVPVVWACNEPPTRVPLREAGKVGFFDYIGWLIASSWIDEVLTRKASSIYVPSEKTRRQVQKRYGRDATVIPLGVDIEVFANGEGTTLRRRLNLSDSFILLSVGKLHPQKNQIVCIEALQEVLCEIPNAVLLLAGSGPMLDEWQREVRQRGLAQNVHFLGHQPINVVRDLYKACDLNLFAPTNQSWGFTPFEALCAGCVSIVSEDSGASEVLEREQIGITCSPSVTEFAERIIQAHRQSRHLSTMAARGRQFVQNNLSWEAHARKVHDELQSSLTGGSHE